MILLATGVMLSAEIFNTAIEAICDFMKTDYDEKIGIIKDVAAATGITILIWLLVLIIKGYMNFGLFSLNKHNIT